MMLFGRPIGGSRLAGQILPKLSVDADDLASQMPEDPGSEPQPELAGSLK